MLKNRFKILSKKIKKVNLITRTYENVFRKKR